MSGKKSQSNAMLNTWLLGLVCAGFVIISAASAQGQGASGPTKTNVSLRSFADWKNACERAPGNRALRGALPPRSVLPLPDYAEFDTVLSAFMSLSKTGTLAEAAHWVGTGPSAFFTDVTRAYFLQNSGVPFEPFAQKWSVPPGSEVFIRGDLHGDIRSINANVAWLNENGYLRDFTITRSNFFMVFLGDYTDRGAYGIEVLYTILRLKLANPDRVFMARGNHEDVNLQARYGFHREGQVKYGTAFNPAKIARACDFLPVVIYLGAGTNFIQCNHGGMEPGFLPHALLESQGAVRFQRIEQLQQRRFLQHHADAFDSESRAEAEKHLRDFRPESPTLPEVIGFMWNDFTVQTHERQYASDPLRAYVWGTKASAAVLRGASTPKATVHAVFRGHQHSTVSNPMMRRLVASQGVFRHWQQSDKDGTLEWPVERLTAIMEKAPERSIPSGSVWTFNVGADSFYGQGSDYSFDSFGLLKTATEFQDWRLRVVNVPVRL